MNLARIPIGVRYIFIGILVALTYQFVFVLTRKLPLAYGNFIAVSLSALLSYFGHHTITFLRKGNHKKYLSRFAIQLVLTYCLSTLIMGWILNHNLHYFYGIASVCILLPSISFVMMKIWTFFEPLPIEQEVKSQRYCWPKSFTPLSPAEQKTSEDFMKQWHTILPKKFSIIEKFNHQFPLATNPKENNIRTLEIGAGLGEHLSYEYLENQEYYCLELRENMGQEIKTRYPNIKLVIEDCQKQLDFESSFFDRILAIHVLEHLPNLPAALREMHRLVKPEGTFSVVIPCDPGLAYHIGRKLSAERIFKKEYNMPYKPIIRREHINSPAEIISSLNEHFTIQKKEFFPLKVPSIHLNLCLGLHLSPKKKQIEPARAIL